MTIKISSEESVRKTIAVNKKEIGKRCKITQASVEKLPFKDNVMDLATAFETVYFWLDPEENFKEVKRILKEGGRFAVINDLGHPYQQKQKHVLCDREGMIGVRRGSPFSVAG